MQEYIKKIHRTLEPNAMIVTSRKQISIGIGDEVFFEVLPMNEEVIFHFIDYYLKENAPEYFKSTNSFLKLYTKIIGLFQIGKREFPINPTLIHLILDKVVSMVKNTPNAEVDVLISELPYKLPDIIIEYLISVNPIQVDPKFSEETILDACECIADIIIGDDFEPRDVPIQIIANKVTKGKFIGEEVISKLIDNGVLVKKKYANNFYLRFNLDMVAEYLSAIRKAKSCGNDIFAWQKLYEQIKLKKAEDYYKILQIIHIAYREIFNWVDIEEVKNEERIDFNDN